MDPCDSDYRSRGSSNHERSTGSGTSTTIETSKRTATTNDDDDQGSNSSVFAGPNQSKQLIQIRFAVALILVLSCAAICFTIYYTSIQQAHDHFEAQYYGNANKLLDALEGVLDDIALVSGIAMAATAESQGSMGSSWPFVNVAGFYERATHARAQAKSLYLGLMPLVEQSELSMWEEFVRSGANNWIAEGLELQDNMGLNGFITEEQINKSFLTSAVVDPIHSFDTFGNPIPSNTSGVVLPRWQASPVLQRNSANENILEDLTLADDVQKCMSTKSAVLGGFGFVRAGTTADPVMKTSTYAELLSILEGEKVAFGGDPISNLYLPVFETLRGSDRNVVAVLQSTFQWRQHLNFILPKTNKKIRVVLKNSCGGQFTYEIREDMAYNVGYGDLHDEEFSEYEIAAGFPQESLSDGSPDGLPFSQESCFYTFHVYPTKDERRQYVTGHPLVVTLSVAAVFIVTLAMFFLYHALVERRQRLIIEKASQSKAIVSSLFPKQIRHKLMALEADKRRGESMMAPRYHVKTYLNGNTEQREGQIIADLFPECTILFCDMAGFTAWSSTREPAQVFLLLQTVFQKFDTLAKERRVFKVETVGDTYLAVTGLPEPQSKHALLMAKFARDCLECLDDVLKDLEVSLGPDTGDLSMRFGVHSGSVTAGVLKGDRARFQLFGDAVNIAKQMENTGKKGKIQVSETTANLLIEAGKSSWLVPRKNAVVSKGKGLVQSYWLAPKEAVTAPSTCSGSIDVPVSTVNNGLEMTSRLDMKEHRFVHWISEIFVERIKKVIIVGQRCGNNHRKSRHEAVVYEASEGKICLDEVLDAIEMPKFDPKVADAVLDYKSIEVPEEIMDALKEYVTMIAEAYNHNPFHNFEHACHVTMSVNKLLSRIVAPDLDTANDEEQTRRRNQEVAAEIHNFTHGLTSDPLAVFAVIFSALIHDVDHQGISNAQLAVEEPSMAEMYRHKSIAEQNSLDVAWDMLMSDRFDELRAYIFGNKAELMRFRQLIVNVVLATDIFDKEFNQLRKDRWEKAFHNAGSLSSSRVNNLRATIVIEHIIQASDVAHTMQHWHVYQKWNRCLFLEMHKSYKAGRMAKDPSEFWYHGELGFFDNYVIPLAKKLKECNVFGVSSDEYLGYATRNREEWKQRGEDVVKGLLEEVNSASKK